jgi:CRP/FNR family transcriptional regulator, anaerobic regulatory protein
MKKLLLNKTFPQFEDELKQELEKRGMLRLYKKGDTILRMNHRLAGSYIILQGSIKAYRENAEGAEFLVAFLKAGQSFGVSASEDSDLTIKMSLLTFEAIDETYLLTLPFDDKDALAKKYDVFYKYILATATMYYSFYLNLIDNIAFKKLDIRIEFFLENLSHITNKKILIINHQEIATSLNCSREAVSRALKLFEEAGKIRMGHNEIEIINL